MVVHREVESGQEEEPSRLSSIELLRGHEVFEILVVSPDLELLVRTFDEMSPLF
jgi:hypothetical protein